MTTIISLSKPMNEFPLVFQNGAEVMERVGMSECTDFRPMGTNAECLIYRSRQIAYSCCYTETYGKLFITSVWGEGGLKYEYSIDYDSLAAARRAGV